MAKKTGTKITVWEGGQQVEKELAVNTCFAITRKTGENIVVAPVVTTNTRGKEVVRFRKVVNPGQCPGTKVLNRRVEKLKVGYREVPKALGVLTGARKAAPAKIWGKLVTGAAKKKKKGAKTAATQPAQQPAQGAAK
jgi:hypothetical protein